MTYRVTVAVTLLVLVWLNNANVSSGLALMCSLERNFQKGFKHDIRKRESKEKISLRRRNLLGAPFSSMAVVVTSNYLLGLGTLFPEKAEARTLSSDKHWSGLNSETVQGLRYQGMLGRGAFKSVYSVSSSTCAIAEDSDTNLATSIAATNLNSQLKCSYAIAVEQLRSKSEAKDEIRGIVIAEQIQQKLYQLSSPEDGMYFEIIYDWWIQSTSLVYEKNGLVFPSIDEILKSRSRKRPTSFIRNTSFLVSFKPVYDMDLKTFIRKCPNLYQAQNILDVEEVKNVVGGISLTDQGALKLVYELCHAGRVLHDLGIVHRDIKPKNIMLSDGHAVIIDFGFANYGDPTDNKRSLCVTELGKIKGELNYVIAQDVALFKGCTEGDMYAMGRTIFETIFGRAEEQKTDSGRRKITEELVQAENEKFRERIKATIEGQHFESRFQLTSKSRQLILWVVQGLCRSESPYPFRRVELELKAHSADKFDQ